MQLRVMIRLLTVLTFFITNAFATQLSDLPCLADATTFHINPALGSSRDLGLTVTIGLSGNSYTPGGRAIPITISATSAFNELVIYAQLTDMNKVGSFSNLTTGIGYNTNATCNNTTPQSTIWSTTDTTALGPRIMGLNWAPPTQAGLGTIQFYACIAQVGTVTVSGSGNSTSAAAAATSAAPAALAASATSSFDCWTSGGYSEAGATPAQLPTGPMTMGVPTVTIVKGPGGDAVATGVEAIGGGVGRSTGWAIGVAVGMLGFLLALL